MINGRNKPKILIVVFSIALLIISGFTMLSSGDIVELRSSGVGAVSSSYGWNITHAGDVNGDGNDDIMVGAPGEDKVYLFFGPVSGTDLDAASANVTIAGPANSNFGWSVSTAFKLNEGTSDDIIIGAPNSDPPYAYIFFGEDLTGSAYTEADANVELNGSSGSGFGWSVSGVGDFNADGTGDVWVGAPFALGPPIQQFDPPILNAGVAYFFNDVASNPSWFVGEMNYGPALNISGIVQDHYFGWSMDFAGYKFDNQDQYADIAIGGPGFSPETYPKNDGSVHVEFGKIVESGNYKGSQNNFIHAFMCDANIYADNSSAEGGHYFGWDVSYAGDFDGDTFDDIIIGAPGSSGRIGQAHVVLGGKNGEIQLMNPSERDLTLQGEADFGFGTSVSWLGDFNEDGDVDVAVGAPNAAGGLGRTYIFYGPPSMSGEIRNAEMDNDINITGEGAGDRLGSAVACGKDCALGRTSPGLLCSARTDADGKVYLYTINRPCELSLLSVNKSTGNANKPFKFTATYTDLENDAPANVKLHIFNDSGGANPLAGSPFDMISSDDTYIDGAVFHYNTTLPNGQAYYRVEASAATGDDKQFLTNIRVGPLVDTIAPGTVIDLMALDKDVIVNPEDGDIELLWTFPGDDGFGTDKCYNAQLRYRNETEGSFTEGNFNSSRLANQWMLVPLPQEGNSQGNFRITLEPEEKYYFAFRAEDEVQNWGGLSNVVEVEGYIYIDPTPPAKVQNVVAEDVPDDNGGFVNVTWDINDEPDVVRYKVYGAKTTFTNVTGMSPILITNDTQAAWAVVDKISSGEKLVNGEYYYFAVVAQNERGFERIDVDLSNRVRVLDNFDAIPDIITGVDVMDTPNDSGGSLTVSWDVTSNSKFDRYKIYVSDKVITSLEGKEADSEVFDIATNAVEVTTSGGYSLKEGKKYYVAVAVMTINEKLNILVNDGNTAGPMYAMDNNNTDKPGTISGLEAEDEPNDHGGSIMLAWKKYDGVTFGYYNFYIDNEPINEVNSLKPEMVVWENVNTYTLSTINGNGLTNGVEYYVAVTVVSYNGVEDDTIKLEKNSFGPVIAINNSDKTPPPMVTGFNMTNYTENSMTFSWIPIGLNILDFQKYVITYYDIDAEWEIEEVFIEDVSTSKYSIVGLVTDSTYVFNISAVDDNGNRGPYSENIFASPAGPNDPPQILSVDWNPIQPTTNDDEITFTCEAIDDKTELEELKYSWDFNGDGTVDKVGAKTGWKGYNKVGTYSFLVTVTDEGAASATYNGSITVTQGKTVEPDEDYSDAIVLGGVFGLVILVLVIILLVVFILNKRKGDEEEEEYEDEGPIALYDDEPEEPEEEGGPVIEEDDLDEDDDEWDPDAMDEPEDDWDPDAMEDPDDDFEPPEPEDEIDDDIEEDTDELEEEEIPEEEPEEPKEKPKKSKGKKGKKKPGSSKKNRSSKD